MFRDQALPERFWTKIDFDIHSGLECWIWVACKNWDGYGEYWDRGQMRRSHRIAYAALVGAIPDGLQLDHLCRNRACVNPAHLEPVTCKENINRGMGPIVAGLRVSSKTHCPSGHPYSGDNLRIGSTGDRRCRRCQRERDAARCKGRKASE